MKGWRARLGGSGGGSVKARRAALKRSCGEVACPHKGWTGGPPTPEWLEGRKLKARSTKLQIHFKNMRLLFRNFSLVGFLSWVSPSVVETLVYFLSSVFCPQKAFCGREKTTCSAEVSPSSTPRIDKRFSLNQQKRFYFGANKTSRNMRLFFVLFFVETRPKIRIP